MRHPSLNFMIDPHLPNNDPFQVQVALENILQEMSGDLQYGSNLSLQERMGRLEAGFMLLTARLTQNGVG